MVRCLRRLRREVRRRPGSPLPRQAPRQLAEGWPEASKSRAPPAYSGTLSRPGRRGASTWRTEAATSARSRTFLPFVNCGWHDKWRPARDNGVAKKAAVSSALRRSRLPEWFRVTSSPMQEARPAVAVRLAALRQRVQQRLAGPPTALGAPPGRDPSARMRSETPQREDEGEPKRRRTLENDGDTVLGQFPSCVVASSLCAAYDIGHLMRNDAAMERAAKRRRREEEALPPPPQPHPTKRDASQVVDATSGVGPPAHRPRLLKHAMAERTEQAGNASTVTRDRPGPPGVYGRPDDTDPKRRRTAAPSCRRSGLELAGAESSSAGAFIGETRRAAADARAHMQRRRDQLLRALAGQASESPPASRSAASDS